MKQEIMETEIELIMMKEQKNILLNGSKEPILIKVDSRYKQDSGFKRPFEGILPILERQLQDANGESVRQKLEKYLELVPCASCHGKRLRPEALAVKLGPFAITDLTSSSVSTTLENVEALMDTDTSKSSKQILTNKQKHCVTI